MLAPPLAVAEKGGNFRFSSSEAPKPIFGPKTLKIPLKEYQISEKPFGFRSCMAVLGTTQMKVGDNGGLEGMVAALLILRNPRVPSSILGRVCNWATV